MAHILLIEPDRVLAEILARTLFMAGHQVTPCASAQSAIMAADQARPDVVILELQLIAHSGIEFLYEFRSYLDWQHIPVLVHTGVPLGEFAASRQLMKDELGIKAYLYKPSTSLKHLLRHVNQFAPSPA
ncbi:MAG TPA: response regulator [Verrucomicrobiae bacterium]|nr:response regulator [Verrucomicrobiae bacterium]